VAAAVALIVLEPAALAPVRVRADHGERLVSAREGSHGTTAVIADPHDRWITVNNSYVLGGAAAADEERWQGHLPLLLHPAPRRVAFLGLGTAITAAAALHHPVERVVALEIVPEVVAAAREDFADVNARVVDDPHLTVVIDDGRNYLAAAPHAFDVIIGDLLVPWRPAEAPLYSQEHFESVRRALTTDGIFCQWLPLYQLSDAQLAIIVKTFVQVFPRTSAWRGNFVPDAPTLALVGHLGTQPLDPAAVDARISALASNSVASSPFLAHPAGLWLFLVGPVSLDRPGLRDAPLNRDSEPWIELLSPRTRADRDHSLPAPELPALLADLARERLEGTPLARLGEAHRAWRAAGAALAQAARQQDPEGKARVLAVLQTLPPELRRALDVEAP
jgi:spermidine synthase